MFNMGSAPSLSDIAAVPAFTVPNPYANCDYGQILNEWIFMEDKVRKPK